MPKSPIAERFSRTAFDIFMNPEPDKEDRAYLARQLVQATLPHSDPGDVPIWQRTNGRLTLSIRPGWDFVNKKQFGYPYGTIPRLILYWLTTEVITKKSRKIELGNSLAHFMRQLELNPTSGGGKRGDAKRLKEQMERLFNSTISFEANVLHGHEHGRKWVNMEVVSEGEYWWSSEKPEQSTLWKSYVVLGEKFYEAIMAMPVPVDLRALRALKHSPLALDLYAWATYRTFTALKNQNPQFIHWEGLQEQLGAEYGSIRDFRKRVKEVLVKVQFVYPALKIEYSAKGLHIHPTQTAVPSKPKPLLLYGETVPPDAD